MPTKAKIFVAVTTTAGAVVLETALLNWHSNNLLEFGCYLLIALVAATMRVRLPGIDGTMSVYFLFVLLGISEFSLSETLVIVTAAVLFQTIWKTKRPLRPTKVIFNSLGMSCNAVYLTFWASRISAGFLHGNLQLLLVLAACVYFLANTLLISTVIALTEQRSLLTIWRETYFWSFPYYLVGAVLVGFFSYARSHVPWQSAVLILPVMYWIYRSYHLYLGRLEDAKKRVEIEKLQVETEKRHAEEVSALHLRTIEALAAAIDAKDHTTHEHLHRVRTYAIEIAREMGLEGRQIEALRAGALLHDIGKLAVPDHIINKPGRLTPEEFDKMKIHPLAGAELLEKVVFPYPVAPIVRSHHEKWDGSGYPDGLKEEEIPIGARILAAVDCLDALASHRQYRRALPLDEAMRKVAEESGISFDPKVVAVLQRRYVELEKMAQGTMAAGGETCVSAQYRVERGEKPGAGFERGANRHGSRPDVLGSIASARQEAQTLFELSQDLGNSLSLDETLSLVSVRLRRLIPYDSIVVFVRNANMLKPEFVSGENFRTLSSLEIPVGEGLCGWVAQNSKPILNGDPAVELGYVANTNGGTEPRSALAVPLVGVSDVVGVLALYRTEVDAFTGDHSRILQVITSKLALSMENALKYRQAESSATTDYLTGLPNARSLFMHLDQELSRCEREKSGVAVMVCDIDGFKQVNDLCGHLEGDKTLKLFANVLKKVCREYDYAARMGGDEFVIIAPHITADAVRERAVLLNTMVQQVGREVSGKDLISLSLGAAFYPQDGSDAEHLLAEADRRMYAAKRIHHEHAKPKSARAISTVNS